MVRLWGCRNFTEHDVNLGYVVLVLTYIPKSINLINYIISPGFVFNALWNSFSFFAMVSNISATLLLRSGEDFFLKKNISSYVAHNYLYWFVYCFGHLHKSCWKMIIKTYSFGIVQQECTFSSCTVNIGQVLGSRMNR